MSPSGRTRTEGPAGRLAERDRVLGTFIESHSERLAGACHEIARAFSQGATLLPFGAGAGATDAAHVAVEFMHPIIVGKRALPALAPSNDLTRVTSPWSLGHAGDIALVLSHDPPDPDLRALLSDAHSRGLLTIAMTAEGNGRLEAADFCFAVGSDDPPLVQEVQETAYHVLWELVHVFFEHPDLLEEACITCGDVAVPATVVRSSGDLAVVEAGGRREEVATDLVGAVRAGEELLCHAGVAIERIGDGEPAAEQDTAFLYPFLAGAGSDLDRVLAEVRASTVQKAQDTIALRNRIDLDAVEAAGREIRQSLQQGGRLVAFGNGGSSTDAQDIAGDCLARGWSATALSNDPATITAVGNDVGFELVFSRQLIALGRQGDVALAISTSGSSPNLIAGLEEARRRGMLTCAIVGYDGGLLADLRPDHLLIVPGDYVPRIQEAQGTVCHLLIEGIGRPG